MSNASFRSWILFSHYLTVESQCIRCWLEQFVYCDGTRKNGLLWEIKVDSCDLVVSELSTDADLRLECLLMWLSQAIDVSSIMWTCCSWIITKDIETNK